jgi:hypothetical protein
MQNKILSAITDQRSIETNPPIIDPRCINFGKVPDEIPIYDNAMLHQGIKKLDRTITREDVKTACFKAIEQTVEEIISELEGKTPSEQVKQLEIAAAVDPSNILRSTAFLKFYSKISHINNTEIPCMQILQQLVNPREIAETITLALNRYKEALLREDVHTQAPPRPTIRPDTSDIDFSLLPDSIMEYEQGPFGMTQKQRLSKNQVRECLELAINETAEQIENELRGNSAIRQACTLNIKYLSTDKKLLSNPSPSDIPELVKSPIMQAFTRYMPIINIREVLQIVPHVARCIFTALTQYRTQVLAPTLPVLEVLPIATEETARSIPLCQFALDSIDSPLEWRRPDGFVIDHANAKIAQYRGSYFHSPTGPSDFSRFMMGHTSFSQLQDKLVQGEKVKMNCRDAIYFWAMQAGLVDPIKLQKRFDITMLVTNSHLKKTFPTAQTRQYDAVSQEAQSTFTNHMYRFVPEETQMQTISGPNTPSPGDIVVFINEKIPQKDIDNRQGHFAIYLGKEDEKHLVISLWSYPFNPDNGESIFSPSIDSLSALTQYCREDLQSEITPKFFTPNWSNYR